MQSFADAVAAPRCAASVPEAPQILKLCAVMGLLGALLAPLDIRPGAYRLRMLGTELALDFHPGLVPAQSPATVMDD